MVYFYFFRWRFRFPKGKKTAMDSNNSAVNGEVAIDFKGDGIYNQRHAPHSPTLGHHAPWRSYNMENKTPEEQVRFYFISLFYYFFFLYFAIDLQFKKNISNKFWKTLLVHSHILKFMFTISLQPLPFVPSWYINFPLKKLYFVTFVLKSRPYAKFTDIGWCKIC